MRCKISEGKMNNNNHLKLYAFLLFMITEIVLAGGFRAYYTKINSGESFEKYSRTGPYADIVIEVEDGKFVFWRGSSYLPYFENSNGKWYVDEIIERKGDGNKIQPDKVNTFSRVSLVEFTVDKAVVCWRYLPEFSGTNPHIGVEATKFVEEYFTITKNGQVTRTIKKGTEKVDRWKDPGNQMIQTFKLTEQGFSDVHLQKPEPIGKIEMVNGSEIKHSDYSIPIAWWKFDEGKGDITKEDIGGYDCEINGHKSLWKKGVSGTALQFDGYNSTIILPAEDGPKPTNGITLEAWIAIGAYPWSWTPIIQQTDDPEEVLLRMEGPRAILTGEENVNEDGEEPSDEFTFVLQEEDDTGYFLGIDGLGHPGLKLRVNDKWEELVSELVLERRTWYHLIGTYDGTTGKMKLYVDGKSVGTKQISKGNINLSTKDIKIGKGKSRRPIKPVRANTFIDSYGFDGLIDEVKIYDITMSDKDVNQIYTDVKPADELTKNPDMVKRVLPVGKNSSKFGAYYSRLDFYETWDNLWRFGDYPDVVVEFDHSPAKFVFWRGVGYIPMMVNDKGHWYTNEFNETWNRSGGQGCQEPMSDKESYTNHARIIENTPARVVVHWRYPLIDVLHVTANYNEDTGWGDWSDWYYYIYPDGFAVKTMHLWTHGIRDHEWHEGICIFGPDQHPEKVLEKEPALILADLQENVDGYNWITGPPEEEDVNFDNKKMHVVNFQSEYDMYTIGDFTWGGIYGGEITDYAIFPTWNHWPVGQMPSDGRYASFTDRTGHSSLTQLGLPTYKEDFGYKPFEQRLLMEGISNKSPEELIPLAKSWLNPAKINIVEGISNAEYDSGQRAYVLDAAASKLVFSIDGSEDSPIVNLAFVLNNWEGDVNIAINGKKLEAGKDFQSAKPQTVVDKDLVVWIDYESEDKVELVFESI
jgi:hypothetical protein